MTRKTPRVTGRQVQPLFLFQLSLFSSCSPLIQERIYEGASTGHFAEEFPHQKEEAHGLPGAGQIGQLALIATMNTRGSRATQGTLGAGLRGKQRHEQLYFLLRARGDLKARRQSKQRNERH